MLWPMHQHHQHLHAAQVLRYVGQHALSLATSPAGQWLCASRNHLRCAQSKPATLQPCAWETHLLAPALRARSSARTCLRAAHRCCDMHCCALLLLMRCVIIWLKLGARQRKRTWRLLHSRVRAAACVLHTAAATLIVVRCCRQCCSVDCSGLPSTIVNLAPCAPNYDSVNVEDTQW